MLGTSLAVLESTILSTVHMNSMMMVGIDIYNLWDNELNFWDKVAQILRKIFIEMCGSESRTTTVVSSIKNTRG